MDIVYFAFAAVAVPIFFFMAVWVIVTVYRVLVPEEPLPLEKDRVVVRKVATAQGEYVPVGARDIREDQRHYYTEHPPVPYAYVYGESEGFPEYWDKDLWLRRN